MRKTVPLLALAAATTLGLAAPPALATSTTAAKSGAGATIEQRGALGGRTAAALRAAAGQHSTAARSTAAAAANWRYSVVVTGLDNPRQLSVDRDGALYVAEAGHGAADPSGCVGTGEETFCVGTTGRISRIYRPWGDDAVRRTVVRDLPSGAGPDGSFAGGAHGVSALANRLYIAMGDVPELTPHQLQGKAAALLVARPYSGRSTKIADLLAYELKANPDGQRQFDDQGNPLDALTNPYAALALPGRVLVADAGANAIVQVRANGRMSTFAALPNINRGPCAGAPNNDPAHPGCDSVPTGITRGPDGYIYVSGLGGEGAGSGRVWKLHPRTGKIVRIYTNLTSAHGIAVGPDGSIYVSELFYGMPAEPGPGFDPTTVGRVTRIAPSGKRTSVQVPLPGGLAFRHGRLYASAGSVAPSTGAFGNPAWSGQIVRFAPRAFG